MMIQTYSKRCQCYPATYMLWNDNVNHQPCTCAGKGLCMIQRNKMSLDAFTTHNHALYSFPREIPRPKAYVKHIHLWNEKNGRVRHNQKLRVQKLNCTVRYVTHTHMTKRMKQRVCKRTHETIIVNMPIYFWAHFQASSMNFHKSIRIYQIETSCACNL